MDENKELVNKKSLSLSIRKHYDVAVSFQADEDNRVYRAQLCIKHQIDKLVFMLH